MVIQICLFFATSISHSIFPPAYESAQGTWAEETLKKMSLRQKIGQLFMVATTASRELQTEETLATQTIPCPYKKSPASIQKLIQEYHIGGLIFLYKSTQNELVHAIKFYQNITSVPLLIGQDAEWGFSMRLTDALSFPRNRALATLADTQLIYEMGREIGRQAHQLGVHITFAPVVDLHTNPKNTVIGERSFGTNPDTVTKAALLMMQGLQDEHLLACAKHFPGHGDTDLDSHITLPTVTCSQEILEKRELVPFKKLIEQGICAIMTAHLSVPAYEPEKEKASSLSRACVTDLLQKKLGHKGLIITDGLGMKALDEQCPEPGERELQAFLAGNDILLCPLDVPAAVDTIESALFVGMITEEELDRRVLKILTAKEWCTRYTAETYDARSALALKEKLFDNIFFRDHPLC